MAKLGMAKILSVIAAGTGLAMITRRAVSIRNIAPEFRNLSVFLPVPLSRHTLPLIRQATKLMSGGDKIPDVKVSEACSSAKLDAPKVRMMTFEREKRSPDCPVLIWHHGGGYVLGGPELDARLFSRILEEIDILIVSVDYRLAPEHPFPAALDDAYTCLDWVRSFAPELRIDPLRISVGGVSAGAGLAAALVQRAIDADGRGIVSQILFYPMLDDRTTSHNEVQSVGRFIWTPKNNKWAWKSYLGKFSDKLTVPDYSVPARRKTLSGLPRTWIGVGTLDLFFKESMEYGRRLNQEGGTCTVDIVRGGYHSFDTLAFETETVKRFHAGMIKFLQKGFDTP